MKTVKDNEFTSNIMLSNADKSLNLMNIHFVDQALHTMEKRAIKCFCVILCGRFSPSTVQGSYPRIPNLFTYCIGSCTSAKVS